MALFNIFNPKKKPLQSSSQVQGSGYSSAYASNPTTQQSYSSAYSTPTPVPAPKPTPSPYKSSTQSSAPQSGQYMSKAIPQIQGSGMTSAYASNPSNYKPITSVPTPQPQQQPQSAGSSWMDYVTKAADRQRQSTEQQTRQETDFINQKYGLANKQLGEQLPAAQETFNRFKGNTEASIADLLAGGERQKSQTKDYYGDAQRQAAQTLRETQGQTQRTFANLGSLDSRGEGSFAQANENTMSDFNRYTQQTLKAQADQLSEIDMQVSQAERSARDTIATEEAKMSELARNIQYALQTNNLNQAKELTDAFNTSQQYIYDIEDTLAQTKYAFALEQEKLQNSLALTQNFTPEFMATGQPTNQAEFEFIIKNQKDAGQYFGTAPTGGKQTEKQMAFTAAGNIAQNALAKLNSGSVQSGFGQKALGSIGEKLGSNSPDQQAYRSDIAAMRTSIQNALLGANMSPKEMEQIMAAIPQFDDAPEIAKSKLNSLITNLPIMAGSGQQVAGQFDPAQIDQILASLGQ